MSSERSRKRGIPGKDEISGILGLRSVSLLFIASQNLRMESLKPTLLPTRSRAVLLATACLITPLMAGEPSSAKATSIAVSITEARELLTKGDEAYNAGRYHDAVQAYSGAREMISTDVNHAELRDAATQRYVQAAVEDARTMVRKGDLPGGKALMDKVIADTGPPGDPAAIAYRTQLDDPIRTNPALTAEHGQNVDEVRRELYTADGAFNLGNFDEAKGHYEKVLQIDAYNSAARRGMERVAAARSDYYKAASDEGRASLLAEVDKQWELPVTPAEQIPQLGSPDGATLDAIPLSARLDRIIIPSVTMEQTSLAEAVEFLRVKARENDKLELDPAKKGVNITLNMGNASPDVVAKITSRRFDLRLTQVPLSQVLRYITQDTQTAFSTDDYSVIISPAGSTSEALITRTFRVPPDFVTTIGSGGGSSVAATADPFAEKKNDSGVLAKKLSAQDALISQGITFPTGASASYTPANSTLRVTNTAVNLDQIEQIVSTLSQSEPVAVAVRITMIKTQETTLKELSFDWMLRDFGFAGASSFVPGANLLNLTGGTVGNGGSLADIVAPAGVTIGDQHPITSGNRSGDAAISGDSIDALIASNNKRTAGSNTRAPGVLGINGYIKSSVVQVMMRGLDQKKGVDLLSQPSVVTRSGQAASVHITREFIYPTEYEPPTLPTNTTSSSLALIVDGQVSAVRSSPPTQAVTPAMPTAFQKRDVGTVLEVLPVADASKKYVDVTVKPTFTEFDGFVNYGVPINTAKVDAAGNAVSIPLTDNSILMPVFNTQRVSSSITIADGATIVIAGMLKEKMQTVEDKVPVLGDLPGVGRMFQSKATSPEKTAIIFLVNVELLDPTGRPYRDR